MDSRVSGHPVSHIRVRDLVFLALGILALIALFLYAPGDGIRAAAPRNDVPEPVPSIEPKISAASPVTCTGWAKTFFLTYINSGGADLTNATIVITVPMWTEVITSESTAGLIPGPNPGTVMWNLGTVTSTAILRELTLLIDPLLDPGTPLLLEAVFDADNAEAVLLSERLPGAAGETYYSVFTGPAKTDLKTSVRDNRLVILQQDGYPANEWENTPKGYVVDLP